MTKLRTLRTASAVALFIGTMAATSAARADQVFNDDVIITGSLCVGFDCVNGMAFGSDTIVLQENNLRIFFNDTSTASGFPNNDWRLIANDSASGGANYFAIEDATAGRQVFRVSAGARTNSIFVSSSGLVGFGTSTPVLSLHAVKGDTPGVRFEQDGSVGFQPYTWDVAGNEANFFVRDVTGGSRLPFRIRPGAPTSSIDIAANGNVGIGVAGATQALSIGNGGMLINRTSSEPFILFQEGGTLVAQTRGISGGGFRFTNGGSTVEWARFDANGQLGIGTASPTAQLHTTGSVRFAGVTGCTSGIMTDASGNLACITSSRRFKNIVGALNYNVALANVMALRPQVGAYKKTPGVPEHWLIAENVAAVDRALAGYKDGKPFTVKTQNVVADLVAVVQHQQRQIVQLQQELADKSKH